MEYLDLGNVPSDGFDIRFYQLKDMRIYDIAKLDDRTVRDLVVVIGDGEGHIFERRLRGNPDHAYHRSFLKVPHGDTQPKRRERWQNEETRPASASDAK